MLKPTPFGFETPNGFSCKHKLQSSRGCFLHFSLFLNYLPMVSILILRVNEVEGEVFGYKKKKGPQDPALRPSNWLVFLQEPQQPQCKIN